MDEDLVISMGQRFRFDIIHSAYQHIKSHVVDVMSTFGHSAQASEGRTDYRHLTLPMFRTSFEYLNTIGNWKLEKPVKHYRSTRAIVVPRQKIEEASSRSVMNSPSHSHCL